MCGLIYLVRDSGVQRLAVWNMVLKLAVPYKEAGIFDDVDGVVFSKSYSLAERL